MVAGPRRHRRPRLLGHPGPRGVGGLRPRRRVRRPADRVHVLPQAVPRRPPRSRRTRRSTATRRRTAWPTSPARTAAPGARSPSRGCSTACCAPTSARSRTSPAWPTCGRRPRRASSSTSSTCCSPSRKKTPFGIGQIGKSFRNEITPGNFIFRTREFEQMEMEFFVKPGTDEEWHEYWIDERARLVRRPRHRRTDNLRLYEHPKEKLSHYSKRTVDIEYRFGFAGTEWGELEGIANRTDFDLTTHSKHSGADLSYFDQETGERWVPYVIEPAAGVDRADAGLPARRLRRGRGAERQGRRGEADRAAAGPPARAGEGRGAAAVPQRRPVAEGPRPGRRAAQAAGTSTSTTPARSAAATAGRTRSARRSASRSTSTRSTTRP